MSKSTPGPWFTDGEGLKAIVRGADQTIVAVRHRHDRDTHAANARLIAAAPELLAALIHLRDAYIDLYRTEGGSRYAAESVPQVADAAIVIAKATATQDRGK